LIFCGVQEEEAKLKPGSIKAIAFQVRHDSNKLSNRQQGLWQWSMHRICKTADSCSSSSSKLEAWLHQLHRSSVTAEAWLYQGHCLAGKHATALH
jgi:hypothetical protein